MIERDLHLWFVSSVSYEQIAQLQLQLGRKQEALASVRKAIAIEPDRSALYDLRYDIERGIGPVNTAAAHRAAGYRAAGDAFARTGEDAQALTLYLRGLQTVAAFAADPVDDDARFELEAAIRNLTEFVSARYSRSYARQFWQSLAHSAITEKYRDRLNREVTRLAAER